MTATLYISGDPGKVNVSGYTKGDILAANASGNLSVLSIGSSTEVLTVDTSDPQSLDYLPGGGGGAVSSVNGQTGVVVLDATDVGADPAGSAAAVQAQLAGYVPTSRSVIAGTALTGGGTLAADVTLNVSLGTTGTTAAAGNDSRIVGAVQTSRTLTAGTGLSGGGDLSDNRSFSLANIASATILGNNTGGATTPIAMTVAQTKALLAYVAADFPTLQPKVQVVQGIITSGSTSGNTGGVWAPLGYTQFVIPAVAGDYVEFWFGFMRVDAFFFLDAATKVGGSAVRYMSTGTGTPALEGAPWWYIDSDNYRSSPPPFSMIVAPGDLSGGNVTVDFWANGTGGTLYSDSNYPLRYTIKNYGQ